jgi:VanZ family protein
MLIRIATWFALLMIILLSAVPGNLHPHLMANKHIERFTAYFVTGCLFASAYPHPRQLFLSGALLGACAAVLELLQLEIPGRTSSIVDFVVSTCGAYFGRLLAFVAKQLHVKLG